MSWDSNKYRTREDYLASLMWQAKRVFGGDLRPIINHVPITPLWFAEREIRVFWEAGISQSTAQLVKAMIEKRISQVDGLMPFDVILFGQHWSIGEQIANAMVGHELDDERLRSLCLSEPWRDYQQGGKQHADVIITKRPFLNDSVSWGAARFSQGTMILALYGNRQESHHCLGNVVLHETNHLLGMGCHCDDFLNVEGYHYSRDCNAHYDCLHKSDLCPKCADFISHWWVQIQYEWQNI